MKKTTLSDVSLNITDGKHGDCVNEENSGFYFVSCKDVKDGAISYESARQITEKDFSEANKRTLLAPNDILITNSGTIGRMAFVRDVPITYKTTFQKSVAIVKPNSDIIYPLYLYYQLQCCVERFINQSNGSAQKNLLLSTMRAFELFIHDDLNTQRRIADILSAYDDLIENNRKQIKLLEEAAQRLYKEWFVDLRFPGHEHTKIVDGVPEGWKKRLLGDIVEVKYGKDHKSISDGLIPVYGSGGFMRKCGQVLYDGESVLIPRKGSLNNIIYVDEAFWTVDTMFYTKMKMPNIGVFLYFFVKSFDMYSMNIGAAVPSMTTNILNALDIIVPSSNILEHFQSTTKMYFRKMELLQKQIETAMQARDRLLPKLMSGEVEV